MTRRSVVFHGFDPFATKKPQITYLEISRRYCADANRTAILILRTPHKFDQRHPVWRELLEFRDSLECDRQSN